MSTAHAIFFPRIRVIGRLQLDWGAIAAYLKDHDTTWKADSSLASDLELASEFAGRVCYDAFGAAQYRTDNASYIENILMQKHGSVLEHASVMLLISGVSRSLTHELIRHRVGVAYSQRSQRYVDESKGTGFILPPELADLSMDDPDVVMLRQRWLDAMDSAHAAYRDLTAMLESQVGKTDAKKREKRIRTKQAARSVLPNATETTIVVTANLRALRHICEVRGGIGAEAEIRRFAVELLITLKGEAPNIFTDMEIDELEDGAPGVRVQHSKV